METTGHWEERTWVSQLTNRGAETIEVFVPHTLADIYSPGHTAALADLEQALIGLSDVDGLAAVGPVLVRSEGIASSRIEGLVMSTRRVYEARLRPEDVDDRSASQIVANMDLMERVTGFTTPLTDDQVHEWHSLLIANDHRLAASAGRYRVQQNWIGGRVDTPVGAEFIPPPPDLVPELMADLIQFVNDRSLAPIVQAAVAHAQFETIHPYGDGNGRVGRALIYWILANRGAVGTVLPPLSPVIVESVRAYVSGLTAYRHGDTGSWIDTFVGLMQGAVGYATVLGSAITDLQASWRERVSDVRAGSVDHRLVDHLVIAPVLDASDVAAEFGITPQAAKAALDRLESRGILSYRSLRSGRPGRPAKVYEAIELFDLLDQTPKTLIARRA